MNLSDVLYREGVKLSQELSANKIEPLVKPENIKEAITSPGPETIKAESKTSSQSELRETRTRMSPLRKRIAERLVDAQQSAALLTTFNDIYQQ